MEIAVDFDGTVVEHEYPNVGKDVPNAVNVLNKLIKKGHNLILYTMRSGSHLEDAKQWYLTRGIPLYGIQYNPTQANWTSSNKCYAHLYIDDAALGCPISGKMVAGARPYVDWYAVENILEEEGIL